jgi:outer membrane biosynthesis protein TonB
MATMIKLLPAEPVSGFEKHIEDFHEFFRSRGVSFGSPGDLPPFVARLAADPSFRDDMASMVRTVIYRERDGVSRLELVEMVAVAVEGTQVENAGQPENREAERQVVGFVDGVFRRRWNPGEASETGSAVARQGGPALADERLETAPVLELADEPEGEAAAADVGAGEAVQSDVQPHATTDLFYRAQMVAGAEPAQAIAEERKAESPRASSVPNARVDAADQRFLPAERVSEGVPATDDERVPFEAQAAEESERRKRTSRFWMWTAAVCALLLAFCAGLVVHQRLLVPLRDRNQPYEQPPADTAPEVTADQRTAARPVVSRSAVRERRAEEARSRAGVRHGAGEFAAPVSRGEARSGVAASGAAGARKLVQPVDLGSKSAADRPVDRAVGSAGEAAHMQPRYMAPAMIGASPALMESHLVYAPEPGYPLLAEMSHIRGRVLVEAVVSKSGRVIRAQAISGHRLLRGAAVREVYERRYKPYLLDDRPTDVATIVTVDFRAK